MSGKPHPILAVPIIALVDAVLMGLGNRAYELVTGNYSIITWPGSFWLLFWYTLIFAVVAGALLAPIFYFVGQKLPEPRLKWLLLAGVVLGPLPISILDRHLPGLTTMAALSLLGLISAVIWWLMVEVPRSRPVPGR